MSGPGAALRRAAVAVAALAAALSPASAGARPTEQAGAPRFEPADCGPILQRPALGPVDAAFPVDPSDIVCGYVVTPLERAQPSGPTIRLAVAVLRATGANREPDPLVMLQGGPGGSTIDTYAVLMAQSPIRATRDVVLFDQRGTGKSVPALACDETITHARATIETVRDRATVQDGYWAAVAACHDRLVGQGVNLSAFDSYENVEDIDSVRRALGYERVNLYGVSYGTLLSMHALRLKPGILRSVVVDAVVTPQTNPIVEAARAENRALTELFAACKADPLCNRDFPDLERVYVEQIDRLDRAPARARMVDPATGRVYNAVVDGETFRGLIFQSLYATELIPLLPRVIYEAKEGYFGSLGNAGSLFAFDQSVAIGMYMSVMCSEDGDFAPADAASDDVRAPLAKHAVEDAAQFKAACAAWSVAPLPESADAPVTSTVPTLILNGRFDPITPPRNGEEASRGLSRATVVTFPNTGHGAFQSGACPAALVAAFVAAPEAALDTRCQSRLEPPTFIGRADVLRLPVYGELLTAPGEDRRREAVALGIGLLILLSGFAFLPLGWLARTAFGRHHKTLHPPLLANVMPWAALVHASLLLIFLVGFLAAPIIEGFGGAYTFFVGISASSRGVFALPWVIAALTALIAAGAAAGLMSPAWGILRKLYRGALAVAALGACAVLLLWGTFSPLLLG